MTCIVGIVDGDDVYIGADSAAVSGYEVRESRVPKVFSNDLFVIGYSTSFRMGQILRYHLRPAPQGSESDIQYMVCTFVKAVRECLKEHGFSKVENNVEVGGFFLVAYRGSLYEVGNDFQVNLFADGVMAIGYGREYALGALRALETMPVRERLIRALEVAAHYSGDVMGPFWVLKASSKGKEEAK